MRFLNSAKYRIGNQLIDLLLIKARGTLDLEFAELKITIHWERQQVNPWSDKNPAYFLERLLGRLTLELKVYLSGCGD